MAKEKDKLWQILLCPRIHRRQYHSSPKHDPTHQQATLSSIKPKNKKDNFFAVAFTCKHNFYGNRSFQAKQLYLTILVRYVFINITHFTVYLRVALYLPLIGYSPDVNPQKFDHIW